jgi:HlyD family secretion protein
MKRAIIVVLLVAGVAAAGAYSAFRPGGDVHIDTAPITRGEIVDAVGSSGTLQAVNTVQVGSQASGNISWLGADFNSIVRAGQVIARIDPSIFEAQVEQAEANLVRAEADLERNRVALADAQTKFARAQALATQSLLPQSDLDTARAAVDGAAAQIRSSQASVVQARASLNQNRVNVKHCVITTPIDGIVIQRSVDVGQTVAASLQSPTLFVIAADLTKMQVNASIDEADVGRIRPGQPVTFRVDAYPGEEFRGAVAQVRLQPVVVQNVTTYATIIDVPNPSLKLKPGMTATLRVQIARRADTLRIPNAALRFRPTGDVFAALNQPVPQEPEAGRGSHVARAVNPGGPAPSAQAQLTPVAYSPKPSPAVPPGTIDQLFAPLAPVESPGRVWLADGNQLKAVALRRGITDGTFTELLSGELQEGAQVVTGVNFGARRAPAGPAGSPFGRGQWGGPGGGR